VLRGDHTLAVAERGLDRPGFVVEGGGIGGGGVEVGRYGEVVGLAAGGVTDDDQEWRMGDGAFVPEDAPGVTVQREAAAGAGGLGTLAPFLPALSRGPGRRAGARAIAASRCTPETTDVRGWSCAGPGRGGAVGYEAEAAARGRR
jgi:hypothetical protein